MDWSHVCPECRAVHFEPAVATYVLVALCLDCEIAVGFHTERAAVFVVAEAA